MKPIFGVDITENKKNERVCGAIFTARTVSPDAGKRLETSVDKLEDVNQKAKLPLPVRILHHIFAFAAVILTVGILRGTLKVGFAEGYANAPRAVLARRRRHRRCGDLRNSCMGKEKRGSRGHGC